MTDLSASVRDYLESLPEAVMSRLFQSPATCLAIFRLLPSLAKTLVMSMLYCEDAVQVGSIEQWTRSGSRKVQADAIEKLKRLHLIRHSVRDDSISLNARFRKSFRNALTAGDTANSFGIACETEDKHKVDIDFLDKHAADNWDGILHFMVGTPSQQVPGTGVLSLLRYSGLMDGPDFNNMRITNSGFQFLLQSVNAQLWTLLLQYLNMSSNLQMDSVDVLNFIFMLGSLQLGRDYSLAGLSETQVQMLEDLRDYGLVYQRKSTSRRFYPTRLATSLTSGTDASFRPAAASIELATSGGQGGLVDSSTSSDLSMATSRFQSQPSQGFIILETNYRLYAYTNSPLQIAVLNLFVHLKSRHANMVSGQITRESVRQALVNGIHADQIITYLMVHAHPEMKKHDPVLPPTVVDQIKLWQLEMDRVQAADGYLYKDFSSQAEYDTIVKYAQELGVLLWQDPRKRRFFVMHEGNAQVVDYVNRKLKERSNDAAKYQP